MDFYVTRWSPKTIANSCSLVMDNWDDFSFKTLFILHYTDSSGNSKEIGAVKIMTKGLEGRVKMPTSPFTELGLDYCSLGQGQSYYEELQSLPPETKELILKSLRDCVFDPDIYKDFKDEDAMGTSLLRSVNESSISKAFRNILDGHAQLTPFNFQFVLESDPQCKIDVRVTPESTPQTNIHVLIGRNGVGKTRILSGIADELTGNKEKEGSISIKGKISFPDESDGEGRFTSLVTIVFSAFDQFTPIQSAHVKGNIRYQYIGLKKFLSKNDKSSLIRFKTIENLETEFRNSIEICLLTQRRSRWINAINILSSDPVFAEYELDKIVELSDAIEKLVEVFARLSSGHKITLLSITRLIELVEERTLVLIDEPETHLHPPLLASFTRAVSDLLVKRNGVALIATHSPVVLQEVPTSCVTIIDRVRSQFSFARPTIETYGENVGTLTREVFRLEVKESGFHKVIEDYLKENNFENLMFEFENQIGSEGRAIARTIELTKTEPDNA